MRVIIAHNQPAWPGQPWRRSTTTGLTPSCGLYCLGRPTCVSISESYSTLFYQWFCNILLICLCSHGTYVQFPHLPQPSMCSISFPQFPARAPSNKPSPLSQISQYSYKEEKLDTRHIRDCPSSLSMRCHPS